VNVLVPGPFQGPQNLKTRRFAAVNVGSTKLVIDGAGRWEFCSET